LYHGEISCIFCGENNVTNIHHIDEDHDNFLLTNLEGNCVPHHMDKHYGSRKTPYVNIVKMFTFDSCHHLLNYDGACSRLHGHTYKIEVAIRNRINIHTGMVMDFGDLKKAIKTFVVDILDHQNLNEVIPELNPTAENMLFWIWDKLERDALLKGLWKIRLWETPNSFAEITQKDIFLSPLYILSYYNDLEDKKKND
jgi:6-pyruvoyltetrahydropterin/6-carboxytetrahydropterin synthase